MLASWPSAKVVFWSGMRSSWITTLPSMKKYWSGASTAEADAAAKVHAFAERKP